jgi:hypothetical protein
VLVGGWAFCPADFSVVPPFPSRACRAATRPSSSIFGALVAGPVEFALAWPRTRGGGVSSRPLRQNDFGSLRCGTCKTRRSVAVDPSRRLAGGAVAKTFRPLTFSVVAWHRLSAPGCPAARGGYTCDCSPVYPPFDPAIRAATALARIRDEWAVTQNAFRRTGSSRRDSENSEPLARRNSTD